MSRARQAAREGRKAGTGRWVYTNRYGNERREDIFLAPELSCSPMVDDYHDLSGQEQFDEWVRYLVRRYPQYLATDAVPIYWSVQPAMETAPPFSWRSEGEIGDRHFLNDFTWPHDAETGERLDWFSLPVINDRFPEFVNALAWTPSPLQRSCPLASIVTARNMHHLLQGI